MGLTALLVCSKAADWDVQAGFTEAQTETLAPAWGDTFHLCVAEASQSLKVYLADDSLLGVNFRKFMLP